MQQARDDQQRAAHHCSVSSPNNRVLGALWQVGRAFTSTAVSPAIGHGIHLRSPSPVTADVVRFAKKCFVQKLTPAPFGRRFLGLGIFGLSTKSDPRSVWGSDSGRGCSVVSPPALCKTHASFQAPLLDNVATVAHLLRQRKLQNRRRLFPREHTRLRGGHALADVRGHLQIIPRAGRRQRCRFACWRLMARRRGSPATQASSAVNAIFSNQQ